MYIDISKAPPPDLLCVRVKHLRFAIFSLLLAVCGGLLAAYAAVSDTPDSKILENVTWGLIVGPGLLFVYFTEKFMPYRKLTQTQDRELVDLGQKHPEIATYCALVAQTGRKSIVAEFEACQAWVEKLDRKN
ncbi:MAG: hypothetical protein HGA96_10930 [Desulfobulbaceae bacterium]|nr:hypothetical protein [Desulfobulbaceae bacterium]